MAKPKVAWYWCASCGGCEESFVDLAEKLLDVFEAVDIVFCPVAMDFKKEDVEKLPDGSITVSFINGGIRLKEHEEMVKLLRRKSKLVVAYGACSSWGGIPGLANLYNADEIIKRKYFEVPSIDNPGKIHPKHRVKIDVGNGLEVELELPKFLWRLVPLDKVIEVDYYIPGCPPTPKVFWNALQQILSGNLPPKGSVLGASDKSLCDECPLNETKPEKILLKEIKMPHEIVPKKDECLLAQGLPCLGPVTRGGCEALCVKANMPCTGCFGPLDNIIDYGGKAVSFLASIIDIPPMDEDELEKVYDRVVDWVGLVYKYNLPASKLGGSINLRRSKEFEEVIDYGE